MNNSAITISTASIDTVVKFAFLFFSAACLSFFPSDIWGMMLGDPAPELRIQKWIKGEPVLEYRPGTTYLIEFWSTRCPHCRDSIPLLSDLQTDFASKDLVVISVSGESEETLTAFVNENDADMQYRVAMDMDRKTRDGFMKGFGAEGVPHAFVVDGKGRVVWEGHPLEKMAESVENVLDGKYDLDRAVADDQAEVLLEAYLYLALRTRETAVVRLLGENVLHHASRNADLLNRFARFILLNDALLVRDLHTALRAVSMADELAEGKDESITKTYQAVLRILGLQKRDMSSPENGNSPQESSDPESED